MLVAYKNNFEKKILMIFCGYLGPPNYVPMRKQGTHCIAPKLCRHTMRGPKLRGPQIEGSKTPRDKLVFIICPAEFWTPQSARNFGPLKECPAELRSNATFAPLCHGHIVTGS